MRPAKPSSSRGTAGKSGSGLIRTIFEVLEGAMGAQHWWPAGSPFEVVVGAYLTQNTAWTNVERAIANLHEAGVLSIAGIRQIPLQELERLVRPAGYFRQKAARLKMFVEHLDTRHSGSLEAMFATPLPELREELLALSGIGPETADSILLYAASQEVFVVDAYTRRIWQRHGLAHAGTGYEEIRAGVEQALFQEAANPRPSHKGVRKGSAKVFPDRISDVANAGEGREPKIRIHPPSMASAMPRSELARRYNEFHALLVQVGKHYCVKAAPRCELCPLRPLLPPGAHPR